MVTELCLPILCVIKALTNLRRLFDHQHPDSNSSFIIDHREKKWALTENLQIHAKKLKKLLLNPEGCSYRRLCKQENEGRKKRKIVNNKHLKVSKTNVNKCKCIPFSKQNLLTDLELMPFLSGNLSFSNKLTSECVFRWVITKSFM